MAAPCRSWQALPYQQGRAGGGDGGQRADLVFDHIAASETQHLTAVRTLLDRYGLTDPTAGKPAGQFSDPAVQDSYDRLLAQGQADQAAAQAQRAAVEAVRPGVSGPVGRAHRGHRRGHGARMRAGVAVMNNPERRQPSAQAQHGGDLADLDRAIVRELAADGRCSFTDLAERVGL